MAAFLPPREGVLRVPIVRMMPVIVVVSVLLAATVCLLAWLLAGRPTRGRARHGMGTRRPTPDTGRPGERRLRSGPCGHALTGEQSPGGSAERQLPGEPGGLDDRLARARVTGPEDDPDFIRQLARSIAEQRRSPWRDGDLPPD